MKEKKFKNLEAEQHEREIIREQTTIRLPKILKEEICKEADQAGLTFNQLVLMILRKWLKDQK